MKQILLVTIFILSTLMVQSQKNTAALLSFKGEGVYSRGKTSDKLKFPMLFNSGDKISLKNGHAKLIIANGEEFSLKAGEIYNVPQLKKDELIIELDASVFQDFTVQSQENSSIKVRNDYVNVSIFPLSSKMIRGHNNRIFISQNSDNLNLQIEVCDATTLDVVYLNTNFNGNYIDVNALPLETGHEYTWMLFDKKVGFEQLGLISVLSEKDIAKQTALPLHTSFEYIAAFLYYQKNEFNFEAYNIVEEAHKKFPEINFFRQMKLKMTGL